MPETAPDHPPILPTRKISDLSLEELKAGMLFAEGLKLVGQAFLEISEENEPWEIKMPRWLGKLLNREQ